MMYAIPIVEPPRPVFDKTVSLEVQYFVVRGNGDVKLFSSLNEVSYDVWTPINMKAVPHPHNPTILVPLDAMSALRLGLVKFDELDLPETARAFINMIK